METLKKFLETLRTDPKAEELLKGREKPESLEAAAGIYAEAAKELGFELTEVDIREGFKALEEEQKAKTEQAKDAAQELNVNDLEKVAGGKGEEGWCRDTYVDRENCWFNDGCDTIINSYIFYRCKSTQYLDGNY